MLPCLHDHKAKPSRRLFGLMFFFTVLLPCASAELNVIYPNVNGAGRDLLGYAVLKLALEHSGQPFDLQVSENKMNNNRIREWIKQKVVSISDFGSSPEYEEELLPIYFPIDMGLNGWRVFIIHQDNLPQFDQIHSLQELRSKEAGQGISWADADVLEKAGLSVYRATNLENLFKMTEHKRFDYFPLGANEAHILMEKYRDFCPSAIVEPKLLLIYPFGRLFFVNKDNRELHDAVMAGLVKAFENGAFWKLFRTHKSNQGLFEKAHLRTRTQICIDNPFVTEAFMKIPRKYFFDVHMLDEVAR